MIIAVSSSGKGLDSQIDPRFGRSRYFIICNTDDMSFESLDNENIAIGGGAGIQSAEFVASKKVKAVITGNCGPNAVRTLSAAGIKLFPGQSGTVRDAIERLTRDGLEPSQKANIPDHSGVKGDYRQAPPAGEEALSYQSPEPVRGGRGTGRGMGMGGGRGMGRGMGAPVKDRAGNPSNNLTKDQELSSLKKQSLELMGKMQEIQARIGELDKNG